MARKQLSGAQKRARAEARAAAAGVLMPPVATLQELSSLTGVIREKGRNYRHWKTGRITHEQYLITVKGLSALATALQAREQERQREIDERLAKSIEAIESRQSGGPVLIEPPGAFAASVSGELMPRESEPAEVVQS